MSNLPYVIYTDGSFRPPHYGAYAVLILKGDHEEACLTKAVFNTTINRMELQAIAEALAYFTHREDLLIYSDSQYAVNCVVRWSAHWNKNQWKTTTGEPVKNRDLIERIFHLCHLHRVTLRWVRGHAGNLNNERCDKLAQAITRAMANKQLLPDSA